jgi:predicted dehydrogenase
MSASAALGGGVVLDLVHELDYVRWLGGPVRQVGCFLSRASHLEIETEHAAAINVQFASGAVGSVNLDYIQRSQTRTCRIIGDEGSIEWDYNAARLRWYLAGQDEWNEMTWGDFERNDRFVAEMKHMLAVMAGEEPARVDLRAGVTPLRMAVAAKESAAKGVICRIG